MAAITARRRCRTPALPPLIHKPNRLPGSLHRYSQLVLATGAQPIRVPLAGDGADQVLSVV